MGIERDLFFERLGEAHRQLLDYYADDIHNKMGSGHPVNLFEWIYDQLQVSLAGYSEIDEALCVDSYVSATLAYHRHFEAEDNAIIPVENYLDLLTTYLLPMVVGFIFSRGEIDVAEIASEDITTFEETLAFPQSNPEIFQDDFDFDSFFVEYFLSTPEKQQAILRSLYEWRPDVALEVVYRLRSLSEKDLEDLFENANPDRLEQAFQDYLKANCPEGDCEEFSDDWEDFLDEQGETLLGNSRDQAWEQFQAEMFQGDPTRGYLNIENFVNVLIALPPDAQYEAINWLAQFPDQFSLVIQRLDNIDKSNTLLQIDNELRRALGLPTDFDIFEDFLTKVDDTVRINEKKDLAKSFLEGAWDEVVDADRIASLRNAIDSIHWEMAGVSLDRTKQGYELVYENATQIYNKCLQLSHMVETYEKAEWGALWLQIQSLFDAKYLNPDRLARWASDMRELKETLGDADKLASLYKEKEMSILYGDDDIRLSPDQYLEQFRKQGLEYDPISLGDVFNSMLGLTDDLALFLATVAWEPLDWVTTGYEIASDVLAGNIDGNTALSMAGLILPGSLHHTPTSFTLNSGDDFVQHGRIVIGNINSTAARELANIQVDATRYLNPESIMEDSVTSALEISDDTYLAGFNAQVRKHLAGDYPANIYTVNPFRYPDFADPKLQVQFDDFYALHAESDGMYQVYRKPTLISDDTKFLRMYINRPPCTRHCFGAVDGNGQVRHAMMAINLDKGKNLEYIEIIFTDTTRGINPFLGDLSQAYGVRIYADYFEILSH